MDTEKSSGIYIKLAAACYLVYVFSISLKTAYAASLVEIIRVFQITNTQASVPLTLYYAIYAAVQVMLAFMFKKINVKAYMAVNFALSGQSFALSIFAKDITAFAVIMAANGVLHAASWPGSMYYLGRYLPYYMLDKTVLFMSSGFAVGTGLAYGITALSVFIGDFRLSFMILGILFLLSALLFYYVVTEVEKNCIPNEYEAKDSGGKKPMSRHAALNIAAMVVGGLLSGVLYYGFSNWMAVMLKDVYGIPSTYSILITILLPVSAYFGPVIATAFSRKTGDDLVSSAVFSLAVMALSGALCLFFDAGLMVAVALLVTATMFARGLINLYAAIIPTHLTREVNIGSTSAIANASSCTAAALSPVMVGAILDISGGDWGINYLILSAFSGAILILMALFAVAAKKARKGGQK